MNGELRNKVDKQELADVEEALTQELADLTEASNKRFADKKLTRNAINRV